MYVHGLLLYKCALSSLPSRSLSLTIICSRPSSILQMLHLLSLNIFATYPVGSGPDKEKMSLLSTRCFYICPSFCSHGEGGYPSMQWTKGCIAACNGAGGMVDTPLGRHPLWQTPPPWQAPPGRHPWADTPPPLRRRPLKRAVRILLECILVQYNQLAYVGTRMGKVEQGWCLSRLGLRDYGTNSLREQQRHHNAKFWR